MIQSASNRDKPTSAHPLWLRPEELAKISSLELRARGVVEGFLQGLHRSPFVGYSVEFSSHRKYGAGDDLRHLNWKIFAKQRKLYVKEFDAETNLNLHLLVDGSRSMNCKLGSPLTKWEYAATLAASIASLAIRQHDAVGLGIMSDGIIDYLDPSARPGRWDECLQLLSRTPDQRTTNLPKALGQAASLARHRGLVIVLSDLVDDPAGIESGLQQLRHIGHEVVVFQLLDPWEKKLPQRGRVKFKCLEASQEVTTDVESIRAAYGKKVNAWCEQLSDICLRQSIDLLELTTDQPPTTALTDYLVLRAT